MAPEVALLGYTTFQLDIYQPGLILYYLLMGLRLLDQPTDPQPMPSPVE